MSDIVQGNLGPVTAYAYAKAGGYTGTEADFQALMAANVEAARYAADVMVAAEQAEEDKDAAAESASEAAGSKTAAETAQSAAEEAANYARTFTGAPRVAATAAAMTDHDLIYVYTGSETGYTAGNWYFWDGTAWASGGVYNSTALETDETLTVSGAAADAKATGDKVGELKSQLNDAIGRTAVTTQYTHVIYNESGTMYEITNTDTSAPIYLAKGETLQYKSSLFSNQRFCGLFLCKEDGTFLAPLQIVGEDYEEYTYTAPENCYVRYSITIFSEKYLYKIASKDITGTVLSVVEENDLKSKIVFPVNDNAPVPTIGIYKGFDGLYKTNYQFPFPQTSVYVDPGHGSDSNDGTEASPYKTLKYAIANSSGNRTIRIVSLDGTDSVFFADDAIESVTLNNAILAIVPNNGQKIYDSGFKQVAWSASGGGTYAVSNFDSTGFCGVFELGYEDENGVLKAFTEVSSTQDLVDNTGTYRLSSGYLYIHPVRSKDNAYPLFKVNAESYSISNNGMLYLENIVSIRPAKTTNPLYYYDNTCVLSSDTTGLFVNKNCQFVYARNVGTTEGCGLDISNIQAFSFGAIASYNAADGISYRCGSFTHDDIVTKTIIELNCQGYSNGNPQSDQHSNASTGHTHVPIIRCGCIAHNNAGPAFADVGECWTICYDCKVWDEIATQNGNGFSCDGGNNDNTKIGYMWVIDCIATGQLNYSVRAGSEVDRAIVYIHNLNSFTPVYVDTRYDSAIYFSVHSA